MPKFIFHLLTFRPRSFWRKKIMHSLGKKSNYWIFRFLMWWFDGKNFKCKLDSDVPGYEIAEISQKTLWIFCTKKYIPKLRDVIFGSWSLTSQVKNSKKTFEFMIFCEVHHIFEFQYFFIFEVFELHELENHFRVFGLRSSRY